MIRTLLTTSAVALLLSTGAIAQEATTPPAAGTETTTEAPAAGSTEQAPADAGSTATDAPAAGSDVTTTNPVDGEEIDAEAVGAMEGQREPWDMAQGYVGADTDNLASRLIDQPVYSSAGDDAEEIGNITDLVFNESGQINAVIIGVGGFLGIGEKSVAVDFQALEFVLAADNTERWVLPTTADALNSAPDFVWEEDTPDDNMADPNAPADGGAMAPAAPAEGGAMAPAAPADGGAMAPAEPAEPADPAVAPAS